MLTLKGSQRVERIRTKLLLIDYPATPEDLARINAIRSASPNLRMSRFS
jgi:hypothetical protein